MVLFRHELSCGKHMLWIWSAIISGMLLICILVYPEMKQQMTDISGMFADMGAFSAAFGMDQLNFGEFIGFFCVECGNILGLGGAFFAALLGISSLAKEEKEQTAEFLLTHPIRRQNAVLQKFAAILTQILILNGVVSIVTMAGIAFIQETPDYGTLALLCFAYLFLQIEIASICFGVSAFLSKGGLGMGLGLAAGFYFLNIISNLLDKMDFLKYVTPFSYTEGTFIVTEGRIDGPYFTVGVILALAGILTAYYWYPKKDIA